MGDRLAMVAFPWLVYTTTGSALSTGVVLAMFTLPYVLFGAVAGGVLDRIDRRGVMVAADIVAGRSGSGRAVCRAALHWRRVRARISHVLRDGVLRPRPDGAPARHRAWRRSAPGQLGARLPARTSRRSLATRWPGSSCTTSRMRAAFTVDAATFGVSAVTLLAMTLRSSSNLSGAKAHGAANQSSHFWPEIREGISYLMPATRTSCKHYPSLARSPESARSTR